MDFDRLSRIIARMMEENGALYAAGGVAVFMLLVLIVVSRLRKSKRLSKSQSEDNSKLGAAAPQTENAAENKAPASPVVIDDDIHMTMELDNEPEAQPPSGEVMAFELDTSAPQSPDMRIGDDLDEVNDLDDITIPNLGQAPPPHKSRFFSASWLQKEAKTAPSNTTTSLADASQMNQEVAPEDSQIRAAASECARLAEIERKLMALRELYEGGLIAPEVYVLKAREFATQVG